jgi:surface protein
MKRIILLIILIHTQIISGQTVVLDTNGVTIKWTGTTVPSPYFVQANPRGTGMEWFAIVDNSNVGRLGSYAQGSQQSITYFTPSGSSTPIPFNNIVTTLVTNMQYLFRHISFNENISSWDVSNVTNMEQMFSDANPFNQNIGSWNVANVTNMYEMFLNNSSFNQNISTWNVSRVTDMSYMFLRASAFNQPIGSWNVSNVTNMRYMFQQATSFNQNISSWNVANVTNMQWMFYQATAFNQNIGSWNVSNVTTMRSMFENTASFNQNIGSWNVSNVTDMNAMFKSATAFNQNIGSWNVSNVTDINNMFDFVVLSTANYDALLIGWATISTNETPLKPNIFFSGGNSKYCNGASARSSIISTYGWTIRDGGLDCSSLDTETFETNTLKLFPNPVVSVLNVKTENNLINQPYSIIDNLGRLVLNGKLNEVESIINVEQLSKGIYYLKIAGNSATKFIKE